MYNTTLENNVKRNIVRVIFHVKIRKVKTSSTCFVMLQT